MTAREKEANMLKKMRGFTLIEMLIVVAIVGLLAALLIPNALAAIQKAKQKGTMKDINSIATAMTDYITDKGTAPAAVTGALSTSSPLYSALSGFYLKVLPQNDQWGNPFYCYTQTDCNGQYGVTGAGTDDFVIESYGRDGTQTMVTFNPLQPTTAYFEINGMSRLQ